uniref:Late embryogenesis abundant protein LEA-2 subgroup domain-containing protein n=1 Tax=Oryza punctata TaxID=4537 RepID=A0A0E0MHZ1_ORYPU
MASCSDRFFSYNTQEKIRPFLVPSVIVVVAVIGVFLTISIAVTPRMKANVEDARLNTFDYFAVDGGGNNTAFSFSYNLSVALAIRNPNKAIGIKHTKTLVAVIAFHDRRLHNSTVVVVDEGFKQRPGKVKLILLTIDGKISSDLLGTAAAEDFKKQNATGLFQVDLRLTGEITNHPLVIPWKHELGASCPLSLQLAPPGPEVVVFHQVNCNPVKPDKIYF